MKKILLTLAASLMFIGSVIANKSDISGAKNIEIEKMRNKRVSYPAVFWSQTGTQAFEETSTNVEHADLLSKVKGLVYDSEG